MAKALGITLRHYQRLEADELNLSPIIEIQLKFIQSNKTNIHKIIEQSTKCHYCLNAINVGDICVHIIIKELQPYCSILCAIRQKLFKIISSQAQLAKLG